MTGRADSLRELLHLQRRMNRLFQEMIQPAGVSPSLPDLAWVPSADVYEDSQAYYVEVELSGVALENVEVTAKENVLRVSGQRHPAPGEARKGVHRMERYFGPFLREFSFPEVIDTARVEAELNAGILHLRIPRKGARRSIEVR
jgi:HSP20 family protein